MRELLAEFERSFDLSHRVAGIPLRERIAATFENIETATLPDWGTKGVARELSEAGTPTLRFYYVPHLFPGMDETLRLAHKLQFHLLPRSLPVDAPLALAAVLESYCHLSGDLLGWELLASGDFLVWILDISGHGVRSGLASALLKILIDAKHDRARVDELAGYLNETLCALGRPEADQRFATGIFLTVFRSGGAAFSSAGHPPAFVRRKGGRVEHLRSNARPLGLFRDSPYELQRFELDPGDRLLLYTDGLSDVFAERAERRKGPDLEGVFRAVDDAPPAMVSTIFRELSGFKSLDRLEDDVTYLAAERL